MSDILHNPDVLSCLANLSNDEVFTPPSIANAMLDLLPQELFSDPKTTFLDPACKSGVFLREIAKRLLVGLEPIIPDLQKRVDHIFHHQLFGIAITTLTSLLSRRSVYCAKLPNSIYSVSRFDNAQGNILFHPMRHTWDEEGKCVYCKATYEQYGDGVRGAGLETHAYEFIHTEHIEDIFNMKFDVIIGNPPYQLNDGGNGVSATPIFQHFVRMGLKLQPRYLTMIIPARWYAGGKGLDDFREHMLHDRHVRELVDFESSKDCFDRVNIAGGICYFLWDKNNQGACRFTNMLRNGAVTEERALDEFPILIRSNVGVRIVRKIMDTGVDTMNRHVYPRNPFGFATNYKGRTTRRRGDVELISSSGSFYVSRSEITKNHDIVDSYKILIGRLVPSNGELDVDPKDGYRVITDTRMIGPGQINTETYLDIGVFKTKEEAVNFEKYIKLKFPRFMLRQAISSLNVTRECFRFVPYEDFTQFWTDEALYRKYNLTQEEIEIIESTIKPME